MTLLGQYVDRQTLWLGVAELPVVAAVFLLVVSWPAIAEGGASASLWTYLPTVGLLLLPLVGIGIYQRDAQRSVRVLTERLVVGAVFGLAAIAILSLPAIGLTPTVPMAPTLAGAVLGCTTLVLMRWLAATCLHRRFALRPVALVIGTGERAAQVWKTCSDHGSVELAAFLIPARGDGAVSEEIPADRTSPTPSSLAQRAKAMGVHEVVVALDERRGALPVRALLDCRMLGINVLDATTFIERETGRVDLTALHPSWLIFTGGFQQPKVMAVVRRALDIGLSAAMLVGAMPVMALVALAIRLEGPGPILYTQLRVGWYDEPFRILKFRSMRPDAERSGTPQWAQEADPRITRVGRVLRRTRLDELPQLINILLGDMSLIGPRPERPEFVKLLAGSIPYYQERHRVRPGLTGWAQVRHDYGGTLEAARAKLEYDLFYLKNQSLLLDLSILLQTIRIVALGHGAH